MIYTDDGQQQMVKWVKTGEFPQKLKDAGFESVGTYTDQAYRAVSLASLFPCSTGTFTSFANHKSRLGSHILSNPRATEDEKPLKNILGFFDPVNSAETIISNINQVNYRLPTEVLLIKVIFILDICDSLRQINKLLGLQLGKCQTKAEYLCRPVSAIAALDGKSYEGDCVETLYRHLINIAIQDIENPIIFHTEKLCNSLYKYYYSDYNTGEKINLTLESVSESGLTSITRHTEWKKCLQNTIGKHCSAIGSVNNIARGLSRLASSDVDKDDVSTIANALNSFNIPNKKFEVRIETSPKGNREEYPEWCTHRIVITEKLGDTNKRTITIGVNEKLCDPSEGHAEILSITVP